MLQFPKLYGFDIFVKFHWSKDWFLWWTCTCQVGGNIMNIKNSVGSFPCSLCEIIKFVWEPFNLKIYHLLWFSRVSIFKNKKLNRVNLLKILMWMVCQKESLINKMKFQPSESTNTIGITSKEFERKIFTKEWNRAVSLDSRWEREKL